MLKNSTIMLLYSERDEIQLNPEYQRMGGVWTIEKRCLLIDSILNDYDLPKIYFHLFGSDAVMSTGKKYAVIDGRQRLESIWKFMDGEFVLSDEFEYQRDPSLKLAGLGYEDIAKVYPKIKVKFDSFVLPVVTVSIDNNDIDLIEDMFSRLNEAVPLNAAEKRNAIGGDFVRAITDLSLHELFARKVKFKNNRYQHREVSARILLVEHLLRSGRSLIDTKKVYLDGIARQFRSGSSEYVDSLRLSSQIVLSSMSNAFRDFDELLLSQGIIVVYYLAFREALNSYPVGNISRDDLATFRSELNRNREVAVNDYASANFEFLEFDRLNQQGTNDASNIKERCRILGQFIGIPIHLD